MNASDMVYSHIDDTLATVLCRPIPHVRLENTALEEDKCCKFVSSAVLAMLGCVMRYFFEGTP